MNELGFTFETLKKYCDSHGVKNEEVSDELFVYPGTALVQVNVGEYKIVPYLVRFQKTGGDHLEMRRTICADEGVERLKCDLSEKIDSPEAVLGEIAEFMSEVTRRNTTSMKKWKRRRLRVEATRARLSEFMESVGYELRSERVSLRNWEFEYTKNGDFKGPGEILVNSERDGSLRVVCDNEYRLAKTFKTVDELIARWSDESSENDSLCHNVT